MIQEDSTLSRLEIWPFLIGRNQTLDYRPILVPDFLKENSAKLQRAVKMDYNSNSIKSLQINDEVYGPLIFVYRSIQATKNGEDLLDGSSRPIYRIEGFICRKDRLEAGTIEDIKNNDALFSQAELEIDNAFEDFWNLPEPGPAEISKPLVSNTLISNQRPVSEPVVLHPKKKQPESAAQIKSDQPYYRRILVAVVLLSVIVILLFGDDNIELQAGRAAKIEDQDMAYISEVILKNGGPVGTPQKIKSSRIISLDTCEDPKCPHAMIILPMNETDKQSLAQLNGLDSESLIYEQFMQSEGLKNHMVNEREILLANETGFNPPISFKTFNILYAVTHAFIPQESARVGKWRLEFHDISDKQIHVEESDNVSLNDPDEVKQSLKSISDALISRLRI